MSVLITLPDLFGLLLQNQGLAGCTGFEGKTRNPLALKGDTGLLPDPLKTTLDAITLSKVLFPHETILFFNKRVQIYTPPEINIPSHLCVHINILQRINVKTHTCPKL